MRSSNVRCLVCASVLALWALPAFAEDVVTPSDAVTTPPPTSPEPSWPSEFFKSLKFSGYLETSYTYNFQDPSPATGNENRARIFDIHSNEFMLNAFNVDVEKPISEESPVGFKVSSLVGQTAPVIQSVGLFSNDFDGDGVFESDGNLDLTEAYIQGLIPSTETTIRLGKFITPVGAEVINTTQNDNFSRSFLFGLAIPFTHTGLYVTQPILKREAESATALAASVGIANGWDNVKDLNEAKALIGNATWTPNDDFSLAGNVVWSGSEVADNNSLDRTLFDIVATVFPLADDHRLKLLLNFDWAGEEGAAAGGGYAQWWGFAGIVRYDLTDQWYVAARGELFDDDDGARTALLFGGASPETTLYELTLTLGYKPVESLLLRGEVRYDHADQDVFFSDDGGPGGTPDENHQTTIAFDAVFMF
jgi:hypothetical protein